MNSYISTKQHKNRFPQSGSGILIWVNVLIPSVLVKGNCQIFHWDTCSDKTVLVGHGALQETGNDVSQEVGV